VAETGELAGTPLKVGPTFPMIRKTEEQLTGGFPYARGICHCSNTQDLSPTREVFAIVATPKTRLGVAATTTHGPVP